MNKKNPSNKVFLFYIYTIIITIIFSNIFILYILEKNGAKISNIMYYTYGGILFLEFILIMYVINFGFKKPIDKLSDIISSYINGTNKGKEIEFNQETSNPKISYILSFMDGVINLIKNIKEEFLSGKAIKSEVQIAMDLQEKLLNKVPEKVPSLEIIAKSKPAGEIGGDSFDVIKSNDNYYIYVGDATGHGVGAGFVMVMVNALVSGFSKIFKKGNVILSYTNEILKPRIKSNIFMTLLMVRWDEENKRLYMTGAGHEYLIVYKHKTKKCYMVKSGGLALGMGKDIHQILKEQEIRFELNDILVLYSDGIIESLNQNKKDGKEIKFGEERLKEAILKSPLIKNEGIRTATGVFNTITIELSKFIGYQNKQLDDITLVVVHYNGGKKSKNDFKEKISEDYITEWNW